MGTQSVNDAFGALEALCHPFAYMKDAVSVLQKQVLLTKVASDKDIIVPAKVL